MWRSLARLFAVVVVAVLLVAPLMYYHKTEAQMRAFRVVEDGVLYRSGQMTLDGLKRAIHDYDIRTVVTLRDAPEGSRALFVFYLFDWSST